MLRSLPCTCWAPSRKSSNSWWDLRNVPKSDPRTLSRFGIPKRGTRRTYFPVRREEISGMISAKVNSLNHRSHEPGLERLSGQFEVEAADSFAICSREIRSLRPREKKTGRTAKNSRGQVAFGLLAKITQTIDSLRRLRIRKRTRPKK